MGTVNTVNSPDPLFRLQSIPDMKSFKFLVFFLLLATVSSASLNSLLEEEGGEVVAKEAEVDVYYDEEYYDEEYYDGENDYEEEDDEEENLEEDLEEDDLEEVEDLEEEEGYLDEEEDEEISALEPPSVFFSGFVLHNEEWIMYDALYDVFLN